MERNILVTTKTDEIDKVPLEQKPEGNKGLTHADTWETASTEALRQKYYGWDVEGTARMPV